MASEFEELFGEWGLDSEGEPKPLSVQTFLGEGSTGPVFAPAASHPGLVQFDQERLVRVSEGDERLSSAAVYAPLALSGTFTLGSRVTLASGRTAAVLTVAKPDVFGLFGFVVVNLE